MFKKLKLTASFLLMGFVALTVVSSGCNKLPPLPGLIERGVEMTQMSEWDDHAISKDPEGYALFAKRMIKKNVDDIKSKIRYLRLDKSNVEFFISRRSNAVEGLKSEVVRLNQQSVKAKANPKQKSIEVEGIDFTFSNLGHLDEYSKKKKSQLKEVELIMSEAKDDLGVIRELIVLYDDLRKIDEIKLDNLRITSGVHRLSDNHNLWLENRDHLMRKVGVLSQEFSAARRDQLLFLRNHS